MDSTRKTIERYTGLVQRHGHSHLSLDWGSRESQLLRFKMLAGIADLEGKSVLDVGCGLCDFYAFLAAEGIATRYSGIDFTPAMIETARELHPHLHLRAGEISSVLEERYDFVFASGILTFMPSAEGAHEIVRAMFGCARIGVAFNSLSTWGDQPEHGELQLDPVATLAECKSLSQRLALRHDYMPHDFTIYLYR